MPLTVENVEFGLLERWRHLVLHDLDPSPVTDHFLAVLQSLDPPDVQPDRGVELQRPAAGGGFGRAEHDTDLLAQLINKDGTSCRHHSARRSSCGGPGSSTGPAARRGCPPSRPRSPPEGSSAATESMTISAKAPERISMSAISSACSPLSGWLTSSESVSTPEPRRVVRVEGMLGVDEGADPTAGLGVRDRVQSHGRLAAGLRAVDLDHPTARQAADPNATSRAIDPVGITSIGARTSSPSRITEPLPYCLSI